jgi:hypothetical protein
MYLQRDGGEDTYHCILESSRMITALKSGGEGHSTFISTSIYTVHIHNLFIYTYIHCTVRSESRCILTKAVPQLKEP